MGQTIAGKGKSTQNIALFSIKSTSSLHLPHLLDKTKMQQSDRVLGNSDYNLLALFQSRRTLSRRNNGKDVGHNCRRTGTKFGSAQLGH